MGTAASTSWPALLTRLLRGEDLASEDTSWAMEQVMLGEATPAQVAGFVVALRSKGESPDEVAGLVAAMLDHAERIEVPGPAVDTCGTGGDRAHTVNISTMSAMVVAGAGARVVKHGNRAASSACGSADLLEELGVVVDLAPERVVECVERAGIAFCFAPRFHPALRHAAAARRELGVATVFNFLGPLANPAQPGAQAVGVADSRMAAVMAQVLADRGVSALVFRGDDGLDELTPCATSQVWVVAWRHGVDGAGLARGRGSRPRRARCPARRRRGVQRRGHAAVPGRRGWPGARRRAAQRRGGPRGARAHRRAGGTAARGGDAARRRGGRQRGGAGGAGRLGRDEPGAAPRREG